jgi:TRAP-type C4-dicarboxylate transport system permease small subunit
VLKIFALVFIPWLLLWLGYTVFSPAYRAQDPFNQLAGLWTAVLSSFFFVTVGFAFVERFLLKSWMHKDWDPRKLPPIKAGHASQFTTRP